MSMRRFASFARRTAVRAACVALLGAVALGTHPVVPQAQERITVGVETTDYFPIYRGTSNDYIGFARDLLDAWAKDDGLTLSYTPLPVRRLFDTFFAGELDLKFPDNAIWQRQAREGKTITYSQPVLAYIDGVAIAPDRVGKGVEQIKTLAMVRGFYAFEYLDRIEAKQITVAEQTDFPSLLQFVLLGRADVAYGNRDVINYTLREVLKRPGALVFDQSLPHTASHYHLSSLRRPELIARFDRWMAANAGPIGALKAKYGLN